MSRGHARKQKHFPRSRNTYEQRYITSQQATKGLCPHIEIETCSMATRKFLQ